MNAIKLSSYIIDTALKLGLEISQMQLQKLLFLIELESFKRYDKSLIDEQFTSFEHGPVIKSIYPYVAEKGSLPLEPFEDNVILQDSSIKEIVDDIVDKYAKYSASYLRNYTHHFYSWKEHFQQTMPKEKIREDAKILNKAIQDANNAFDKVKDIVLD